MRHRQIDASKPAKNHVLAGLGGYERFVNYLLANPGKANYQKGSNTKQSYGPQSPTASSGLPGTAPGGGDV